PPPARIGPDAITVCPCESEPDHAAPLAFIESLPFTYLHVFSFSKRPGTKAAALSNGVPGAVIKRRARELRAVGEAKAAAFRQSQLGRILRVLTLRSDEHPDCGATPALSSNYLKVRVGGIRTANRWLDVRISNVGKNDLVGSAIGGEELYDSKITCAS